MDKLKQCQSLLAERDEAVELLRRLTEEGTIVHKNPELITDARELLAKIEKS